jgi:hypothetical protein
LTVEQIVSAAVELLDRKARRAEYAGALGQRLGTRTVIY